LKVHGQVIEAAATSPLLHLFTLPVLSLVVAALGCHSRCLGFLQNNREISQVSVTAHNWYRQAEQCLKPLLVLVGVEPKSTCGMRVVPVI
jgi:hypothetical protein